MNFKPDISRAERLASQSLTTLQHIPLDQDAHSPAVTDQRRSAYDLNMTSQDWIAKQFGNTRQGENIISMIHQADAMLETANWATVGKKLPDGSGSDVVNIPLAIEQTRNAVGLLHDARVNATGWWKFS